MVAKSHFTVGEVGRIYGEPDWKIRRIVDSLGSEVPRAGGYRLIPRDMLGSIGARLGEPRQEPAK